MIETKCLKNLYNLINHYYNKVLELYQTELEKSNFEELDTVYNWSKHQLLDYKVSIYKNIENKKIPFIEILDINNNEPYNLTLLEAEFLRNYIGLYDKGKKPTVKELNKRFGISNEEINIILQNIMIKFGEETFQENIIEERNKFIRENIQTLHDKILEYDISFLNITDNFIEILRIENINKIKDIINLNKEQIIKMNVEYGYNAKIVVFPKRIINEIESLGLKFKNELMINQLFDEIENEKISPKEKLGNKLKTTIDLICARQFEPEILNRLDVEQQLYIDEEFNNGYLIDGYNDMEEDALGQITQLNFFGKPDLDYTNGKTYYMDKN